MTDTDGERDRHNLTGWREFGVPPEIALIVNGSSEQDLPYSSSYPLGLHEAGAAYLAANQDLEAVTLISQTVAVPGSGAELDVGFNHQMLIRGMVDIGYRLFSSGLNIADFALAYPNAVSDGELPDPNELLGFFPEMSQRQQIAGYQSEFGFCFITFRRGLHQEGKFVLGWCDPVEGRSGSMLMDSGRLRRMLPYARFVVRDSVEGGADRLK